MTVGLGQTIVKLNDRWFLDGRGHSGLDRKYIKKNVILIFKDFIAKLAVTGGKIAPKVNNG